MSNTANNNPAAASNRNDVTEPSKPIVVKVDEAAELIAIRASVQEIIDGLESLELLTNAKIRGYVFAGLNAESLSLGARLNRLAKNPRA